MPAQTNHPVFMQPRTLSIKIWRYMDFTKFVSMLESSSLFFCRSDRLEDPFEGSYSRGNLDMRPVLYKDVPKAEEMFAQMAKFSKWIREWTYINCWHMNEQESAAMWKLYAYSNEAVAAQSTYSKLVNCLPEKAFVGCVQYIDYNQDWLPEGNTMYPFTHKRKSFEHEREVRAVIQDLPIENDAIATGKPNKELGITIQISLQDLVENIYVAPTTPEWFRDLVEGVAKRYGYSWAVHKSLLDSEPVY